jgi:2,4-dienoyl-CoA reductase-like NADH-dependent reductase (Old Yellow Enzyme family)
MSALFQPFNLKSARLRNRIAVAPMCQYVATDGLVNDWHRAHYPAMARGGSGLVIVEASGVSPEGRITPGCLGLWNDRQAELLKPIADSIRAAGAVPGIQLAHAGRKASANLPWEGDDHIADGDPRGWETIAPSAIPFGAHLPKVPREMTTQDIKRVQSDFVASARRARDAGFEWLELHFAHGYLGQSFLSAYSNQRTDSYGGDAVNRARFLVETVTAVREVWPDDLPLSIRLGVVEFDGNEEETISESIDLIKTFKREGADLISVSMGFSRSDIAIPWAPGVMVPTAGRIRREADVPVATAWSIDQPVMANQAIVDADLDLVMIARAHLANPHWPYYAAHVLGVERPSWTLPPSYAHWLERYPLVK